PKSVTSVYLDTTSIDIDAIPNSVKILVLNNLREYDSESDCDDSDASKYEYYQDNKEELKEDFDIRSHSITQLSLKDNYGRAYINLDEMPPNLLYLKTNECKCVIKGKGNGSIKYLKFEIESKVLSENFSTRKLQSPFKSN
ncbi:hypothetical protein CYY_000371, partial [Polysphondylium violaceum]